MKQKIEEVVDSLTFGFEEVVTLDQLKQYVKKLEGMNVHHISIEPYKEYDSPAVDIDAVVIIEETDEEYKIRSTKEAETLKWLRSEELELLKSLRQKYPNQ